MEQIIATHRIKPSSPTPLHFKTHKLSFLDQIIPPVYVPLIFFYQNDESEQPIEISRRLKQSLSETLTIFYPFAGTMTEDSYVDCNDNGTELVEARVHADLAHFTQQSDDEKLKQLIHTREDILIPLLVKLSHFDCGGFAVGVSMCHRIGDMSSFIMFMNAWAATCHGKTSSQIIIPPSFDLALHFPPTDIPASDHMLSPVKINDRKSTLRRFVFEKEKLEKLKKLEGLKVKDPTTVEALSAFIWKIAIKACKAESKSGTLTAPFVGSHVVNLRPRTVPPIPDHTFGNCISRCLALVFWEEDERESGVHVSKIRAAIREVDNDYISDVVKDGKKLLQKLGETHDYSNLGNIRFSSWWRFPMYDVDFRWGKPVWVATCSFPPINGAMLMSTPSGDGIEAWVIVFDKNLPFIHSLQTNSDNLLLH